MLKTIKVVYQQYSNNILCHLITTLLHQELKRHHPRIKKKKISNQRRKDLLENASPITGEMPMRQIKKPNPMACSVLLSFKSNFI